MSTASARYSECLLLEVGAFEDLVAALVDHLALLVHHLVVLEDVLADLCVALLDRGLGALDRLADHLRFDRHVIGERPAHHPAHGAGREEAHEVVFEGQVEPALARVTLPPSAPSELVVDAAALVPLGAQNVEATELAHLVALGPALRVVALELTLEERHSLFALRVEPLRQHLALRESLRVATEQDVDASTGHVRGDGDRAEAGAGLGDDVRLTRVLLRVPAPRG